MYISSDMIHDATAAKQPQTLRRIAEEAMALRVLADAMLRQLEPDQEPVTSTFYWSETTDNPIDIDDRLQELTDQITQSGGFLVSWQVSPCVDQRDPRTLLVIQYEAEEAVSFFE